MRRVGRASSKMRRGAKAGRHAAATRPGRGIVLNEHAPAAGPGRGVVLNVESPGNKTLQVLVADIKLEDSENNSLLSQLQ